MKVYRSGDVAQRMNKADIKYREYVLPKKIVYRAVSRIEICRETSAIGSEVEVKLWVTYLRG